MDTREIGHELARPRRLLAAIIACAICLLGGNAGAQQASRNILLIIADDFGLDVARFYPLGLRQSTVPPAPTTPNLTRLARKGVRFNNVWAYSNCSPTRASIFTGRYGFRTGIGQTVNAAPPWPVLSDAEITLPEAISASRPGYELVHIGKWHLGHGLETPRHHGWQHFSGPDPNLTRIENPFSWPKVVDGVTSMSTTYITTDQVDDALREIDQPRTAAERYFIWLALNVPHEPFHKPPNNLHSRDALPVLAAPDPALSRAYYEAMIEAMDTEIGRLLDRVDLAATTVIFVADNGTPGEVVAPPYDPDHGKLEVYELGVRVPLIVAGAGVTGKGRASDALVNTVDLYPTILELAGVDPATVAAQVRLDGVSLVPLLADPRAIGVRSWAYTERFGLTVTRNWQRAIRDSRYKLIERKPGSTGPVREFFDLSADPFEQRDLLRFGMSRTQRSRLLSLDGRMEQLLAGP